MNLDEMPPLYGLRVIESANVSGQLLVMGSHIIVPRNLTGWSMGYFLRLQFCHGLRWSDEP